MRTNPQDKPRPFYTGYAAIIMLGMTALTWFRGDFELVAGYDFATSMDPGDELKRALYLWDERLYAGAVNIIGTCTIPYLMLQHGLEYLTGSLRNGQMIFFALLFTLPGLAMLGFLKEAFEDRNGVNRLAFFGALFYMFNPYVFAKWNRGELIALYAYGLIPVLLYLIERGIKKPVTLGYMALFGAAVFLLPAALGHAADFLIITAMAAIYGGWRLSGIKDKECWKRAFYLGLYASLLSAWWALPLYLMKDDMAGTSLALGGGGLDLVDYYSSWAGLLKIFKLWFTPLYPTSVEFGTQFYRPGTILIPLIAFCSLFFRADRRVIFFAWIGVAGLWLSKGTSAPIGSLYEWFYENFPYFFIFRAPSRCFPVLYTLSLAVLSGYAISAFLNRTERFAGLKAASILAPFIAGVILLNAWPLFSKDHVFRSEGDRLYPGVFVKIPEYYKTLDGVLREDDGYRLHSFNDRAYLNYIWGYSSTDILPRVVNKPQTLSYAQELSVGGGFMDVAATIGKGVESWGYKGLESSLGLLGARHIVLIDDIMRRYLPDFNTTEVLESVLDNTGEFKRTLEAGPVKLYENSRALPHFYAAPSGKIIHGRIGSLSALGAASYLEDRPALFFLTGKNDVPQRGIDEDVYVRKGEDKGNSWNRTSRQFTLLVTADNGEKTIPVALDKGGYILKAAFPRYEKGKKTGSRAEFSSIDAGGFASLENCLIETGGNGVTIRPVDGRKTTRAVFDLKHNGGPVDLENFPFVSMEGQSGTDVKLILGLDTDGDGRTDDILENIFFKEAGLSEMNYPAASSGVSETNKDGSRPRGRGMNPLKKFNAGEALRKKWGYPGRNSYRALWAAFELPASANEQQADRSIALSSIEFYHHVPVSAEVDKKMSVSAGERRFDLASSPIEAELPEGASALTLDRAPEKTIITISSKVEPINKFIPEIKWVKKDPADYKVAVLSAQAGKSFWLVFNESFHPGWKAYMKTPSGRHLISEHYKVNGFANAWLVTPKETGGVEISIEFAPQMFLQAGAMVSVVGAVLGVGLASVISFRRRRRADGK